MGPVFRAYDAERERLVAIKLFKLDLPPERVHQFVTELEYLVAADLNHPAIARPIAVGISGVSAYVALDYVSAESLDLAVREYGPAPANDALRVALQLAGALDFAAIVNIHHGALHPRDVLLSSDETRLTGLGIARALQQVGIPVPVRRPYTAPERISAGALRESVEEGKADLFSLAAVVYELMTGKRIAGTGEAAVDAIGDVVGADNAVLRRVFARALADAADERFATGLEFVEALKAAFPESQVVSPKAAGRASKPPAPELPLPFDVAEGSDRPELQLSAIDASVDLPLAAAEDRRFEAVGEDTRGSTSSPRAEIDPLVPASSLRAETDPLVPANPLVLSSSKDEPASSAFQPEVLSSVLERSRSAVWPLVLALFVGLAVGFAGGYGVGGSRDRSTPPAASAPATPPPSGQEFTENAVPAAPVTSPKPQAPTPEPAAPTASESGRLLVRSTPAGAHVTIDGKDAGVTPAVVRDLTAGAHRVHVSRDGYAAVERRVTITRSHPAQSLTVELARDTRAAAPERTTPGTAGAFAGSLYIASRPSGAKVFLDGKLIGTTPLSMTSVQAGEHAVRLEYDGYRRWTSSVRIIASEQNRVTASLER